jgi:hypothetical protein
MAEQIRGRVARLITDEELIMNVGSSDGVEVGHIYAVLDPLAQNVKDPTTGLDLGSLDRVKARVAVTEVGEKLSLARVIGRDSGGLSAAARVFAGGATISRLTSNVWVDGVEVSDPVVSTGQQLKPRSQASNDS